MYKNIIEHFYGVGQKVPMARGSGLTEHELVACHDAPIQTKACSFRGLILIHHMLKKEVVYMPLSRGVEARPA